MEFVLRGYIDYLWWLQDGHGSSAQIAYYLKETKMLMEIMDKVTIVKIMQSIKF